MDLPAVEVKKILFATDLSEHALQAFAYAVSLANLYRAGLTIIHVIAEDPDLDERIIGHVSADTWKMIKQRHFDEAREALIGKRKGSGRAIKDVLDTFCEKAQVEGCAFEMDEILVTRGNPPDIILETLKEKGCDLVVMGSHGYSALKDALMGGTSRRVVRRSMVPVVLVPLPPDE
jgi:nucleotide-binding universal stress UspA family protein